jgi:hypothetical protein
MTEDGLIVWEHGKRKNEQLRASTDYGHLSLRSWKGKYRGIVSLEKTEHSNVVWLSIPKDNLFDATSRVREMHDHIQEHIVHSPLAGVSEAKEPNNGT